jgi:glycosyltransferase involved in cell wall biosynthesis
VPRVSVLIPAYNAAPWIEDAVHSMLNQSYRDLEVVVIDDGSTDPTLEALARVRDPRLRVEHNPSNLGLVRTLNRAMGFATGEIVARMDADDLSPPTRLAEQIHALEHFQVDVVSSGTRDFRGDPRDPKSFEPALFLPQAHEDILAALPFYNSVSHATALFRRASLEKHARRELTGAWALYDPSYLHAEDYELWSRLAREGLRFHNLPRVHLHRRLHSASVTISESATQTATANRVRGDWRAALGLDSTGASAEAHFAAALVAQGGKAPPLDKCEAALLELREANRRRGLFDERAFARAIAQRWWNVASAHADKEGLAPLAKALASPLLSRRARISARALRLFARALFSVRAR